MSCGLAIFVKTPALTPVKTRLWPDVGRRRAEALYLVCAEAVASVAAQQGTTSGLQAYWAVAETRALHTDAWRDLPHLDQGGGSLGERMSRIYAQLRERHHAAILVGADAPQLDASMLRRASDWLCALEPRQVLGRAFDGGFWLFGANSPIETACWTRPAYSADDTAERFAHVMAGHGRRMELGWLHDLDTVRDLPSVLASLSVLPEPTTAQRRAIRWLTELQMRPATP